MPLQVEVCIESVAEAFLANKQGVDRIEVCSALDLGGLTPSYGLTEACSKLQNTEAHILIRPHAGDFVYTNAEIELMEKDISMAAQLGAKGVVFGCLTTDNNLNTKQCTRLLAHAKSLNLEATFHRAIDFVSNFKSAFLEIQQMGFDRILSSGQKSTAHEGLTALKELASLQNRKIQLMAGGGINAHNLMHFAEAKLDAVHFSIRKKKDNLPFQQMGNTYIPNEQKLSEIQNKIQTYENN